MNEPDRQELERLKEQMRLLQSRLSELAQLSSQFLQLSAQIAELELRLKTREVFKTDQAEPTPPPIESQPASAPPPIPPQSEPAEILPEKAAERAVPEAVPSAAESIHDESPPVLETVKPPSQKSSFEMRLGTYWLVRLGVVMLLTGLVFFANLAYKKWIVDMGPGGKVISLYLAGAALLGIGGWLYRKQEVLKNYAQVLVAGGLAEVYFTTYAAHHFEVLRVIQSPVLDAVLLLLWAAFIVGLADWKKSEVLALFAVGLSYYNAVITHVGLFTLYSNMVLAIAATVFLVRNRWTGISLFSLAATYASYAFWRFCGPGGWHWASPEEGLWTGIYFLVCYWIIFTVVVFISREWTRETGQGRRGAIPAEHVRVGFLSLNNTAFFLLFVLTMMQVRQGGFWKVSLCCGTALLGLAIVSHRVFPRERLTPNAYLAQGLLLVTLGFITYFTGLRLALVLAVEGVALLLLSKQLNNSVLRYGSFVCGALTTLQVLPSLHWYDQADLLLGTAVALLLLFSAWRESQSADPKRTQPAPGALYFTGLALVVGVVTTWRNAPAESRAVVLAFEALVFALSLPWARLPELAIFGQVFLLLAQVQCINRLFLGQVALPWWNPVTVIAITVFLSHWWQRRKETGFWAKALQASVLWLALATVAVLFFWLRLHFSPAAWLAFTSLLAILLTVYGLGARVWSLAAFGQLFLVVSILHFILEIPYGIHAERPSWYFGLTPIATLWSLSLAVLYWFKTKPGADQQLNIILEQAGTAYRAVAALLGLLFVFEYIPEADRFWVFATVGAVLFLWHTWKPGYEALITSGFYTLAGLTQYWRLWDNSFQAVYWPNLLAILSLWAQQQIARRHQARVPELVHSAMILLAGLSLWLCVTHFVRYQSGGFGFYLTAAWAALALAIFYVGFMLRERIYRWLGLAILAAALGRVIIFDIWRLETVYRILSFTALGIVLLILGFIYNKYQEKIRSWL